MILASSTERSAAIDALLAATRPIMMALQRAGGTPYLVGGAVRDALRGAASHDQDLEVHGLSLDAIASAVAPLGRVEAVGRSYRVLKLYRADSTPLDIAPAPDGRGIVAALGRRDFTWNALAVRADGELVDPYGGLDDLRARLIRHVSPAFDDDPLRVLRAMRFAARYDLRLCAATAVRCRALLPAAAGLAASRIWGEWERWAMAAAFPGAGLRVLAETGWLEAYPELQYLVDPERLQVVGRRCTVAAALARRAGFDPARCGIVCFALLVLGDDTDPALLPETRANTATTLLTRLGAPHRIIEPIAALCRVGAACVPPDDRAVARLAWQLAPADMRLWEIVCAASAQAGRPARAALELAEARGVADRPAEPLVQGRDLIGAGIAGGPTLGSLLRAAYQAQLDGAFATTEAGIAWAQAHHRTAH